MTVIFKIKGRSRKGKTNDADFVIQMITKQCFDCGAEVMVAPEWPEKKPCYCVSCYNKRVAEIEAKEKTESSNNDGELVSF